MRIRKHVFYQAVTSQGFRVCEPVKKAIALRIIDRMDQVAFLFVTKCFSVANEKLKVARVWLIDVRIVNLVDDSVTDCEPNAAAGMVSGADAFFSA
jgi:hypothetical protein